MANRFWVGGTGTYDAASTTHWSAVSGGASGASAPTAADDAFIDANSGGGTITFSSAVCRSLDCTGAPVTTLAWASSTLTIGDASGGALKLVANITTTNTAGSCNFVSTSNNGGTGWGITLAGKALPATVFNGAGGKWVCQDNFSCSGNNLTVTAGGFFSNGKTVLCLAFISSGAGVRTVDITNSTVTCTTGITAWNFTTVTNLTLVSTGSTITMSNALAQFQGGGLSYGTVSFTSAGGSGFSVGIGGTNTFVNLSYSNAGATKFAGINVSTNQTVTGTLTIGGSNQAIGRIHAFSGTAGTTITITMTGAAVVISGDCTFTDLDITGSPSWTNAGGYFVGDGLGNGALIVANRTAPTTQTATGTASFTWSTHGWTTHVPLPQDTVVINNAFVAGRTITADMPLLGGDITFAGGSGSPILNFSLSVGQSMYGSLTLVAGVTITGASTSLAFRGRSALTITSAACSFGCAIVIAGPGSTYALQDAFSTSFSGVAITTTIGTLDTNSQTVTFTGANGNLTTANGSAITTGSSTFSFQTTGAVTFWNMNAGCTFTGSGCTITLTATSASTRTFAGGGKTYGTLTYTVAGSTGQLTITGSNSFAAINFSDVTNARTLAFTNGTTTTLTAAHGFDGVVGTSGKLMSIQSTSAGSAFTLSSAFRVSTDFLSVKDSTASGLTPFYAGANSTNVSGNTNWSFLPPIDSGVLHLQLHLVAVASTPMLSGVLHLQLHLVAATLAKLASALHLQLHLIASGGATVTTVGMGGAISDAVMFGPSFIDVEGVEVAPLALEVVDPDDLATVIDSLDDRHSTSFRDDENDTGAGRLTYQNDDTVAAAAVAMGFLVNFIVYGVRAWTMLVESMRRQRVAAAEELEQHTTVAGRGHLAMWEQAAVYPARGPDALPIEEDRVFNWTSPVFDDTAWGFSASIGRQDGSFAYWTGLPNGDWPDPSAEWIWANKQDPSYPDLDEWSPAGTCYFRHLFNVPAGVYKLHVYFTADAMGKLYIDGAQILENIASLGGSGDPNTMSEVYVDVTPGDRLFAVQLTNDVDPEGDMVQNPGGFLVAIYSADQQGNDLALLDHTDATWKIVEYPDHAPGMTPGEVIRVALDEVQARGGLPGWTLAFSDTVDSAGVAWPEVTDIATKVGTNYLTFLKELTVTYVDVWAAPGALVLYAWVKGGRGSDTTVVLQTPTDPDDPSTGNIYELTHTLLT